MSKEFALQTFGIILQGELALYTCGEYFSSSVERNKIGLCSHIKKGSGRQIWHYPLDEKSWIQQGLG